MRPHDDIAATAADLPHAEAGRAPACVADPDADVVALVAAGEREQALRHLMQRYGRPVHRLCREALHDAALADDVHQQVFIQAFRDLATFGRRSALRAWLFAIARHRVLDAVKARGRAQAHLEDADVDQVEDPLPAASDLINDAQLQRALVACLAELDDQVRLALLLRYQQGLTYDEMAVVCREKPSTLHARVTRALPALRRRIEARIGRIR